MRQRTSVRLEADTALDILEVRRHALAYGRRHSSSEGLANGPGRFPHVSIRLKAGLRNLPCFPGQHEA